jgi:hypothetical protein
MGHNVTAGEDKVEKVILLIMTGCVGIQKVPSEQSPSMRKVIEVPVLTKVQCSTEQTNGSPSWTN